MTSEDLLHAADQEESGEAPAADTVVFDGMRATMAGIITSKKTLVTKNNKMMAFVDMEDLLGNVEVVVFPRDYERYSALLAEDAKIFVKGRANVEEDKDGKLICEQILSFEEAAGAGDGPIFRNRSGRNQKDGHGTGKNRNGDGRPGGYGVRNGEGRSDAAGSKLLKGIWVQFPDADSYYAREKELLETIADSDGNDDVVIFLKSTRGYKVLPPNQRVCADHLLEEKLMAVFGRENVKIR